MLLALVTCTGALVHHPTYRANAPSCGLRGATRDIRASLPIDLKGKVAFVAGVADLQAMGGALSRS